MLNLVLLNLVPNVWRGKLPKSAVNRCILVMSGQTSVAEQVPSRSG